MAELLKKGLTSPENLTEEESMRMGHFLTGHQHTMMKAHKAYKEGFLSADDWNDQAYTFVKLLQAPGGRVFRESATRNHKLTAVHQLYEELDKAYKYVSER